MKQRIEKQQKKKSVKPSGFFKKITKIVKLLARLPKKRRKDSK